MLTVVSLSLAVTEVTLLLVPRSSLTDALYWPADVNVGTFSLRLTRTSTVAFLLAIHGVGMAWSDAPMINC